MPGPLSFLATNNVHHHLYTFPEPLSLLPKTQMTTLLQVWALPAALLAVANISATWYNAVSKEVPEPYLVRVYKCCKNDQALMSNQDEFFHIPQAQKYCQGDYTWDPKITTPPGLYLVAKLLAPVIGCDTASLRALNVVALCLICPLSYGILRQLRAPAISQLEKSAVTKAENKASESNDSSVLSDANAALNIALFPPLFFFSALFYTDVMSTLIVLLSYNVLLKRSATSRSVFSDLSTVVVGVVALFFRQTNIFWVAIFPAGLSVIEALKGSASSTVSRRSGNPRDVLQRSWNEGAVHDCGVEDAEIQDYVFLLFSVAIAALRSPLLVLRVALPYLVLLGLFAGFVAWNGTVVLGDKSAHTATIHLPQMLYLWPYITFFSAPLLVGPAFATIAALVPKQLQAAFQIPASFSSKAKIPGILVTALFLIGAFTAVHFNTIIHPYTLADNRHYVFYVFRILRLHPATKYMAVPIYAVCAWLAFQALSFSSNNRGALEMKRDGACPTSGEASRPPVTISFIFIWLASTALSVVTAPLVEPRYFIIPWVIWRLRVQSSPASLPPEGRSAKTSYDARCGTETLWLLAINIAVTYTFIYRGFTWPSESGKVQRFLW
ncbi:DIE2/ALG10 family-domain-containing protein [Paraphoma chrysanthemicola]|uniref:Dol-P-Glc:Glc(2)Man(9)GlcNAc(2)-PP-Dol alpha-1,2-glucosyltransferase n=1 Tax=Paraphoma chrysanthemicola TaxID=798071 RepID=A0A8K0RJ01_9PLEO|nr:DIE2/ALG10 family-domain-containing protein [Paraphoma chrysanthemicola]